MFVMLCLLWVSGGLVLLDFSLVVVNSVVLLSFV